MAPFAHGERAAEHRADRVEKGRADHVGRRVGQPRIDTQHQARLPAVFPLEQLEVGGRPAKPPGEDLLEHAEDVAADERRAVARQLAETPDLIDLPAKTDARKPAVAGRRADDAAALVAGEVIGRPRSPIAADA